ncbi:MAG: hypothetical protein JWO56_3694 [Acidobacteria bacterium]|nr:hypothetical protein [Acidobacteriota bacterium]
MYRQKAHRTYVMIHLNPEWGVNMKKGGFTRFAPIVLAGVLLLGVGVWKQRYSLLFPRAPLHYGQHVESATLQDGGERVTLGSGRWDVILIDDSGNGLQLASYLQFLLDSGRYAKSAINPVVLVQNDIPGPVRMDRRRRLHMPIVPIERHESELIQHGFLFDDNQVVFINPERQVAFATSFAKPNDLRQLFDKFIPRAHSLVELRSEPIAAGDEMPAISLTPVTAGPAASRPAGPATWIVFGGKCSGCVLSSYTLLFSSLEPQLLHHATASGAPVSLVFSSLIPSIDLRDRLKQLNIRSPAFIAGGPMRGIESDYTRLALSDTDVVVITTNAENHIVRVVSFETYVQQTRG